MALKDALLSHLSLQDIAEEAGAVFRGASSHCPLHRGDNPSAFHLYDGGRKWHCFTRCPDDRNDGDLISFYMTWKNLDFPAALHDLASRLSLPSSSPPPSSPIPPSPNHPITHSPITPSPSWQSRASAFLAYAGAQLAARSAQPVRAYLFSERGLRPETWDAFHLGYNPADIFDSPTAWGLPGGRKIWLPRGIVIPGLRLDLPWYIKIRRPLPGDLLSEYIPPATGPGCLHPVVGADGVVGVEGVVGIVGADGVRPASNGAHLPVGAGGAGPDPNPLPKLPNHPSPKFAGPRGGRSTLFGADLFLGHTTLLLTEGEWDAMLAWQLASDLCDVATLGSASNRPGLHDLAHLACYLRILAVYDDDPAGDRARHRWSSFSRVIPIPPPAHDLSDYFRGGGDLRSWIGDKLIR